MRVFLLTVCSSAFALLGSTDAFAPTTVITFARSSSSSSSNRSRSSLSMSSSQSSSSSEVTRIDFIKKSIGATIGASILSTTALSKQQAALAAEDQAVTLPNGVSYTVVKSGDGPKPDVGELAAIRFKALCGENVIDDIYETPEPYYTRIGSGGLLKGVEETLPLMRVGDRWVLTIPGNLAFGKKGRPASAGKPRIPADATITYDVEMVGLPGKEPELIELIGDF